MLLEGELLLLLLDAVELVVMDLIQCGDVIQLLEAVEAVERHVLLLLISTSMDEMVVQVVVEKDVITRVMLPMVVLVLKQMLQVSQVQLMEMMVEMVKVPLEEMAAVEVAQLRLVIMVELHRLYLLMELVELEEQDLLQVLIFQLL